MKTDTAIYGSGQYGFYLNMSADGNIVPSLLRTSYVDDTCISVCVTMRSFLFNANCVSFSLLCCLYIFTSFYFCSWVWAFFNSFLPDRNRIISAPRPMILGLAPHLALLRRPPIPARLLQVYWLVSFKCSVLSWNLLNLFRMLRFRINWYFFY